jgi:ribokinase
MSGRVIVVGSINIDLVARVPQLPHPGETVLGGTYEHHHGGKGGNQAVAAARLGRPTLLIGAVGDDTFGSDARRALHAERVDVSMVATLRGEATGIALILVDSSGENEIAVVPGANGALEAGYARDSLARLGPLTGDVLLVCNEVPGRVIREALLCGQAAGATTIFNPAPATDIDRAVFGLADILTPNRTELEILLRTDGRRPASRHPAATETTVRARALMADTTDGPGVRRAVIVTLGAAGVVVLRRAEPLSDATSAVQPTPGAGSGRGSELTCWEVPAEKVATIDTTGAGDAFCGALAASLAEGRPLPEAVHRAVAAAALATTRVGAREGMPSAVELGGFLASR